MASTINWDDLKRAAAAATGSATGKDQSKQDKAPKIDYSKHKTHSKRWWIIFTIIAVVVIGFAYWWFHPSLSLHSEELWVFMCIFILVPLFIIFHIAMKVYASKSGTDIDAQKKYRLFRRLRRVPLIIIGLWIILLICSATWFPYNAWKYGAILQTTEYDFASDIQEVNYSQIPVIDRDSAVILGNRAMGSIADYVSQFEIDSLYSQINYQNTPVRVSPLGYADFFKWIFNRSAGIPAYVLVNMTTQDTEVVRLGDSPIHYSRSEPFCRNIDRYVQLKYPFYMFEELSFEIDEDGHPWWICPVQKRTVGWFGGETIDRVVMVDASTGECQDLAVSDVPQWVDRVYPADLLIRQYNWSGLYVNGWWNSWIGQSGVVQTTPGTDGQLGYNYIAKDDDVWVYTGVTSATADNSIIGFVLINQRTAESHFYSVAGATEQSAMASAEGQVQNLDYSATFPLLLNINGQPTYFMALKDYAGLVKKYAMLDIQRYQNVAVGDTVSDCQKSYKSLLATNGALASGDTIEGLPTTTGTIATIATAVVDGNSHFYLTLEGDSHIYDCPLPSLIEIVAYRQGDKITLTYSEGDPTRTVTAIGGSETAASGSSTSGSSGSGTSGSTASSSASKSDISGSTTSGSSATSTASSMSASGGSADTPASRS